MAALIKADEIRERFDIDSEIYDKRIEPAIGSASRRLRLWVGATVYTDALLTSPTDADRKEDLKNAEAHLVMHFAILGLNSPLSGKGVVATAMAAEGKEVRRYLAPKETAELAQMYLETADEIARPYKLAAQDATAVLNEDVDLIAWRTSDQL